MKWVKDTSNLWVIEEIKANKMVEIDRANEESNCFGFAATGLNTGHLLPSGGVSTNEAAFDAIFADHGWLSVLLPPKDHSWCFIKHLVIWIRWPRCSADGICTS